MQKMIKLNLIILFNYDYSIIQLTSTNDYHIYIKKGLPATYVAKDTIGFCSFTKSY
jgi:hypothetical protein